MKQIRNLLIADWHVPSRQELLLSRPRNIPPGGYTGMEKFKHAASMDHAWSASVLGLGAPKQALSNSEAASNGRHGCFPRWQFGERRHGKHMYPLSATSPSARRQMLSSRAPPAISNTSKPVDRLLAPSRPVPSLFPDRSTCSSRLAIRRSGSSTLRSQASDRFKETAGYIHVRIARESSFR
jgi:hypothetical protein